MKLVNSAIYLVLFLISYLPAVAQQCPQTLLIKFTGYEDSLCAPATRSLSFTLLNGPSTGTVTSQFMTGLTSGTFYNQFSIPGGGVQVISNYTAAGKYIAAVQVTVTNGTVTCTGSATYTTQVFDQTSTYCNPLGITETVNDARIHLFPNPTTGVFTLASPGEMNGADLILSDVSGREIHRWILAEDNLYEIPSTITAGTYQLSIRSGGKEITGKLMLIR